MGSWFQRCVVALLAAAFPSACSKPSTQPPGRAGVSQELAYPVLLIGQASLDLRDSQPALTNVPGASSLNLNERVILDAKGRVFDVVRAEPVAGQRSIMWDMGTSPRHFFIEIKERSRPPWAQIQELVIAEIRSPRSTSSGDEGALERVRSAKNPAELFESVKGL